MSSSYGGGGGIHTLYGVIIDKALQSNDAKQMADVLKQARSYFQDQRPHPLYAVVVDDLIKKGTSRAELQQLLDSSKAAISKLEAHLKSS